MVKQKNLILSSIIIFIIFVNIYSYSAPEYNNREYILDEYSAKFNEQNIFNFLNSENALLVSGGCYNVELLYVNDFLKLNIPLIDKWNLILRYFNMDYYELSAKFKGYGLNYVFTDAFSMGFLANPTHYKNDSDISLITQFNGYNTKNTFIIMFENIDNNYSQKNKDETYPFPRIYEEPDYKVGDFYQFPINLYFETSGFIRDIKYYSIIYNKLHRKEHHYINNNGVYQYVSTLDSSAFYVKTTLLYENNFEDFSMNYLLGMNAFTMNNSYFDSTIYYEENDNRASVFFNVSYENNNFILGNEYKYSLRTIENDSNRVIYNFRGHIIYPYFIYKYNKLSIELGEIFNKYDSEKDVTFFVNQTIDTTEIEKRLLLTIKYSFSEDAEVYVKKGFETDIDDIENGGKFFLYDKMYVQFSMSFDSYLKR